MDSGIRPPPTEREITIGLQRFGEPESLLVKLPTLPADIKHEEVDTSRSKLPTWSDVGNVLKKIGLGVGTFFGIAGAVALLPFTFIGAALYSHSMGVEADALLKKAQPTPLTKKERTEIADLEAEAARLVLAAKIFAAPAYGAIKASEQLHGKEFWAE